MEFLYKKHIFVHSEDVSHKKRVSKNGAVFPAKNTIYTAKACYSSCSAADLFLDSFPTATRNISLALHHSPGRIGWFPNVVEVPSLTSIVIF